jgi:hypothetical protein
MFRKIMALICVCSMLSLTNSNANAAGDCGCGAGNPAACTMRHAAETYGPALLATMTAAFSVLYAYWPRNTPFVLMARNTLTSAARSTASAASDFAFSPLGFATVLALGTVVACHNKNTLTEWVWPSPSSNQAPSGSNSHSHTELDHNADCSNPDHDHSAPAPRSGSSTAYTGNIDSLLSTHP